MRELTSEENLVKRQRCGCGRDEYVNCGIDEVQALVLELVSCEYSPIEENDGRHSRKLAGCCLFL